MHAAVDDILARALDAGHGEVAPGSADLDRSTRLKVGRMNEWMQTMPGKAWYAILRLHGPLEPWFDKAWQPGEIERVDR